MSFTDIGVTDAFAKRLEARGITTPSDVQKDVIPTILEGRDIVFRSATGTGKTLAYLLPLLSRIIGEAEVSPSPGGPAIVVLAPSFELCAQIRNEADSVLPPNADGKKPSVLLTGDANTARQIERLKKTKPVLVVGTAGRFIQLTRMGKLKLRGLQALVLDEADRLHAEELDTITRDFLALLPRERQTIACSATITARTRQHLSSHMKSDARQCDLDDAEVLRGKIEHWAFFAEQRRKVGLLRSFINAVKPERLLVFTDRGAQVGNIVGQLVHHGVAAGGLFGKMDKKDRQAALTAFRNGKKPVLVTSDLAARGLDVPELDYIVELDIPQTADAYAHRAGRTARAGRSGVMASFGDEHELPQLAAIEKKLGIVVQPRELYKGEVLAPLPPDADATEVRE